MEEKEIRALERELAEEQSLTRILVKANIQLETNRRYLENDLETYRHIMSDNDKRIAELEEASDNFKAWGEEKSAFHNLVVSKEKEIYALLAVRELLNKELACNKELVNSLKLHTYSLEEQARQADKVIASQDKEIAYWKRLYEELLDDCDTTQEERKLIQELRHEN